MNAPATTSLMDTRGAAPVTDTLAITWPVAAEAVARTLGVNAGPPDHAAALVVALTRGPGRGRLGAERVTHARVIARVGGHDVTLADLPVDEALIVDEHGMTHADVPGVVYASWHADGRLLYARTPWLSRVGLPGGVADRPN